MAIFRKPSILPPGMYDVQITSAKACKSKKTGNDMVVVTAEVRREGKTHSVRDYLVLDGATWKFESFASAIGEAIADGEGVEPNDYVGRFARVAVGVEEFQGRQQNKIKKWLPADPTPRSETNTEEVQANGATPS